MYLYGCLVSALVNVPSKAWIVSRYSVSFVVIEESSLATPTKIGVMSGRHVEGHLQVLVEPLVHNWQWLAKDSCLALRRVVILVLGRRHRQVYGRCY